MINNDKYGGFIVSKNILNGNRIKYTFREKSSISKLNGWTLYSEIDDEDYVNDPNNFLILTAESVVQFSSIILDIFDEPYGTDLCWIYNGNNLVGFYDFVLDKELCIEEMINRNKKVN